MSLPAGTPVQRHDHDTETGTVLGQTSWGAYRIAVDVVPGDWERSAIGPPSRITAVWESWETARIIPAEATEPPTGESK